MAMKVLHVIGSLGCGGAQVVVRQLVENVDSEQIKMFVYPLRSSEILMPIKGNVITRPYPNYDPRKFFTILSLCRKYHIDILVAHLTKPTIGCLFASFFCKSKLVIHDHGAVLGKGLDYFLYRLALKLLWRRASAFVAVSQNVADGLAQRIGIAPDRINVIANVVEFDVFDPERISPKAMREKLGICDDDIILGFVGRLNYVKGVDLLIKATALLLQRSQRYLLLLVGHGREWKPLEGLVQQLGIADRVRFLGFRNDIPEIMATFDIGIVPSRQESFGIVCLELMRMKIPVISSGVGGMAEYITNERTGLLLKENNPEEICSCIIRLSEDEQLRKNLIDAAYRLCERFSVEEYAESFQRMYEELKYDR